MQQLAVFVSHVSMRERDKIVQDRLQSFRWQRL